MGTVKNEGYSYIDRLIDGNGNWILEFTFSNFGDNVLILLPNFHADVVDMSIAKMRKAVIDLLSDEIKVDYIVNTFIRDRSNQPFIVRGKCLEECIKTMEDKLSKLIVNDDYSEFDDEFTVYYKFLKLLYKISNNARNGDERLMNDVYYKGWIKFINI